MRLCAIYSSVACETCDWYRRVGGITSLCAMCESLATLAHNLAIAAALFRAYDLGWDACIESEDSLGALHDGYQTHDEHDARIAALWQPGCDRTAP
jgi:hypothetical protein